MLLQLVVVIGKVCQSDRHIRVARDDGFSLARYGTASMERVVSRP